MAAQRFLGRGDLPLIDVLTDWTGNWNAASPAYTSVMGGGAGQDGVRLADGITWERGRPDKFQSASPGSLGFTFGNRDRTYEPTTNSNMVPRRPTKVVISYPDAGTAYQQGDFMLEDYTPMWDPSQREAVVKVQGTERWAALSSCPIVSSGFLPTTDCRVRLGALADLAGWPTGAARSFAAGSYHLSAQTYQNTDVLAAMQGVASGQAQVLYETRSGVLTTAGLFSTVSATGKVFGDNPGGFELGMAGVEAGVGGGYWYTQVVLTAGGSAWVQNQPNTVTKNLSAPYAPSKFGTVPFARTIAATDKTSAQTAANSLASSLQGQATYRINQVEIRPLANPATLFPVVLGADLGYSYTFKWTPPGGTSRVSTTAVVRAIKHEIRADNWIVTWTLGPS